LNRLVDRTNALDGVTAYTYDALGRRTQQTDPNGNRHHLHLRCPRPLSTTTDALGGVATYTYDANDNRLSTPINWGGHHLRLRFAEPANRHH